MKTVFKYLLLLVLSGLWIYVSLIATIIINGLMLLDLDYNQVLEPVFYYLIAGKVITLALFTLCPNRKLYFTRTALGVLIGNIGIFVYANIAGSIDHYSLFLVNFVIDLVLIMILCLIINNLIDTKPLAAETEESDFESTEDYSYEPQGESQLTTAFSDEDEAVEFYLNEREALSEQEAFLTAAPLKKQDDNKGEDIRNVSENLEKMYLDLNEKIKELHEKEKHVESLIKDLEEKEKKGDQ